MYLFDQLIIGEWLRIFVTLKSMFLGHIFLHSQVIKNFTLELSVSKIESMVMDGEKNPNFYELEDIKQKEIEEAMIQSSAVIFLRCWEEVFFIYQLSEKK